jgi:hypothetical protein
VNETALFRTVLVLTVFSVLLHAVYYYVQIAVLRLPPSRFPYWWSITGSAMMIWLPLGLWRGGSPRFSSAFAIFTFLTGIGMCYGAFTKL